MIHNLCLITEFPYKSLDNYLSFLQQAILGGVTSVQFRDKTSPYQLRYDTAVAIKNVLSQYQIPLIINDDLTLAKTIQADGIHLGQNDISPADARKALGPDKIIGLSIETIDQLYAANELDYIDYIAASAVFNSQTKPDCKTIWGLDGLRKITQQAKYPVIAIGGITPENARAVIQQGASGVAVVSALHQSSNPALVAQLFIQEINQGAQHVRTNA